MEKEVEAYAQLLAEERSRLVDTVLRDHRPWRDEELGRLSLLDSALTAIVNDDSRRNPALPPVPSPPRSTDAASEPGSDYRVVALAQYTALRENFKQTFSMVAEYGRWMVATIAAANISGIYFVGALDKTVVPWEVKEHAVWALVLGLVSILLCALVTYFNWQWNSRAYDRMTHPDMLIFPNKWPKDIGLGRWINASVYVAIFLGISSVIAIVVAAVIVSRQI